MRLNIDYKDPQSYIYLIDMDDSSYIQTQVSLPLVVHYTKFKRDSQGSLLMPVKRMPESSRELFHHRIRNVWINNEYHYFFTSSKES